MRKLHRGRRPDVGTMIAGSAAAALVASPIDRAAAALVLSLAIVAVISLFPKIMSFEANLPQAEGALGREYGLELKSE